MRQRLALCRSAQAPYPEVKPVRGKYREVTKRVAEYEKGGFVPPFLFFSGRTLSTPQPRLRRMNPATSKPKAEIAHMLGISRQHLHDILAAQKPVSAEVAVHIAKLFGNEPLVWIRMQGAYDAWHASREVDVPAVPTLIAAE
jgi:addiction module HigA family antidote